MNISFIFPQNNTKKIRGDFYEKQRRKDINKELPRFFSAVLCFITLYVWGDRSHIRV